MLIDYNNFKESRTRIAGIDALRDGCPTESAQRLINDITEYIEIYEPRFLRNLLGPDYAAIIKEDSDLRDMLLYSPGGTSIVASYVYFFYTRDHATANTPAGEKVFLSDNTAQASSNARLANLWNDMVDECRFIAQNSGNKAVKPNFAADIFHKMNVFNL